MRQYFVRLENDHVVPKGTRGYGFDGFLNITANAAEFLKNQTQATKVLQATTKIISQEPSKIFEPVTNGTDFNNDDPNRDQGVGLFGFPAHRDPLGRRVSARTAVFEVWNASNPDSTKKYPLTVSLNSLATKVLFDRSGKLPRAIGVEYLLGQSMYSADPRYNCSSSGAKKQVFARMEIIVLGGIFNTPQLLILSGIGPKVDLQNLSIEVIIDLPGVGTNLQDNLEMGVVAFSANKTFTFDGPICTFGAPGDPCLAEWYEGKGQYTKGLLAALRRQPPSTNAISSSSFFKWRLPWLLAVGSSQQCDKEGSRCFRLFDGENAFEQPLWNFETQI